MKARITHLMKALDRYVAEKGKELSGRFTYRLRAILTIEERQRLAVDLKSHDFTNISPDILSKIESDDEARQLFESFRELLGFIRKAGLK